MGAVSPTEALLDAANRGDLERFDSAAEALGGGRGVLEALLATEPERARDVARRLAGDETRLDVSALVREGALGLWVATRWILETLPRRGRGAPMPLHEQWDALLGIHAARPEAVWLAIELVAALTLEQRALGRRAIIGLERRFGERARRVARSRLALGPVPLAELLAPWAA